MKECVFCKIIKNKIPSFKVYEDESVLSFLAKEPVSDGHLLVIPKKHFENIFDTPEKILQRMIIVSKKLSLTCKNKLNCDSVNILNASGENAQQSVFHLHFHVVPRYENDKLDLWLKNKPQNLKDLDFVHKKLVS